MTAIEAGLKDLRRQHPEWEPWLAVVQEVLSETVNPEWDSLVPIPSESQQSKVPVLAGITLTLERRSIRRLLEKLVLIAHRSGTSAMASLEPALHRDLDLFDLFKASLYLDRDRLRDIAAHLAQTRRRFKRLQLSYRSLCCMPAIGDGHHLDLQVGRKAIVRSAAPGRHFPKCAASSGADISAAAAVAASGRHGPCSVPIAA